MFLPEVFAMEQSFLSVTSVILLLISLKFAAIRPSTLVVLGFHAILAYLANSLLIYRIAIYDLK